MLYSFYTVPMILQTTATLVARSTVGSAQELILHAPALARALTPGQAILIKTGWGQTPYLRRTFYPIALDDETWAVRVPASADWGHAWLSAAPLGTELDCLGPVGIGFNVPLGVRHVLCVGAGELAWTLLPAVKVAESRGLAVALAVEARSVRELIPPQRLPAAVEYHIITPDMGRPTQRWTELLTGSASEPGQGLLAWADLVLAGAPLPFYGQLAEAVKAVRYELARGVVQALYPADFLCGVGACQACVADVAGGRRRVCLRGPVFDLADIQG